MLLTELFPPDIGGSANLFGNIYGRIGADVTVFRDSPIAGGSVRVDGYLRVVGLPMREGHWGLMNVGSLRRYRRVASRLARESRHQPAIVHCGRALPEGLAALCAGAWGRATPFLCWTHGEELRYARESRELRFLLARVHRRAGALVANSRNTGRELMALGVPSEKIHVVYPGVDVQRFARATRVAALRARFTGSGDLVLLTVGRLQRRKGHDLVIEALGRLRPELPGLRYVIAGDGEERPRLESLVADLHLQEQVLFAGPVPEDELPGYYASADIFVHPNRVEGGDFEGFGIVFLEAAAAGLPTIGGASGGVPEAIAGGMTGMLVNGTDVSELAAAIGTLARSEPLRRTMGEAGRARVERDFTWDRAASQVIAIHQQLSDAQFS